MSGAEPFLIAAAVASAAGTAVEGVNSYQVAHYQNQAMRQQADQAARDATSAGQQALDEGARTLGEGITIAAKNGGAQGSALDVLSDVATQSMYEARNRISAGMAESEGLINQARATQRQGEIGLLSSALQAGATLMGVGMKAQERRTQAGARAPSRGAVTRRPLPPARLSGTGGF